MKEITTDLGTFTAIDNELYELEDNEWQPLDLEDYDDEPELQERLHCYLEQLMTF